MTVEIIITNIFLSSIQRTVPFAIVFCLLEKTMCWRTTGAELSRRVKVLKKEKLMFRSNIYSERFGEKIIFSECFDSLDLQSIIKIVFEI